MPHSTKHLRPRDRRAHRPSGKAGAFIQRKYPCTILEQLEHMYTSPVGFCKIIVRFLNQDCRSDLKQNEQIADRALVTVPCVALTQNEHIRASGMPPPKICSRSLPQKLQSIVVVIVPLRPAASYLTINPRLECISLRTDTRKASRTCCR